MNTMGRKPKTTTASNRARILDTTARLIKERGISGISLADIAAAVNMSKGTLHYYYPSKSELIFDIAEQSMNHMTQKIFRWVDKSRQASSPEDILKVVLEAILKARSRGQIHLYLIMEAFGDEGLRKRFCDEYTKWLAMIRTGLDSILPAGKDTALLAQAVLIAIYGLLLGSLLGAPRPPLDKISHFLFSIPVPPAP